MLFRSDQALTLVVVNAVSVTTTALAQGTTNQAYSVTVAATGGSGTYTWTATGLPAGLSITSATGEISGTPTTAATSTVTVTVTDPSPPARTTSKSLSLVVALPLAVTTASVPAATQGTAYSTTLAATGGSGTRTWSVVSGSLPSGITLSTGGVLGGTATVSGSFTFTARVSDTGGRTADQSLTLAVVAPLVISTASLPQGTTIGAIARGKRSEVLPGAPRPHLPNPPVA